MGGRDEWYNRAKQEGYRSRAAYKLQQLDDLENVIEAGDRVVDLGAAPGGWLQVAAERVGPEGSVVGLDRQRIDPLEEHTDRITTIRGDITAEETMDRLREELDAADVVLSDMAPNVSGEFSLDQARSLHLAELASNVALTLLEPGGSFIVKVFQGPDVEAFREHLESTFRYVRATSPEASRSSSSEIYFIAKGRLDVPVEVGDELEVTIESRGEEGDGVATVEGYPLFVPETDPGDTVSVSVEEVKERFGFAAVVD